ncbi:MAG TPA: hypothetical protein VEZ48_09705 [Sphingomonadaceae bacterium]|nr:hypothetical protein [Sphingomonadaceae bacterium]
MTGIFARMRASSRPISDRLAASFLVLVVMAGCATAEPRATTGLAADIEFIDSTVRADHPGYVAGVDPDLRQRAARAYAAAKSRRLATTPKDHDAVLLQYASRFDDPHFAIQFNEEEATPATRSNSAARPAGSNN